MREAVWDEAMCKNRPIIAHSIILVRRNTSFRAQSVFAWKKLTHNNELTMFNYETEKRLKYYDKVIEIYKETGYSSRRIAKLGIVPVGYRTIAYWIANFVSEKKESQSAIMKQSQSNVSEECSSTEIQELQKRIKELEAQLLQAQIKAEFYDEMINVAEAKFKIPIRKKAGAKQ